MKTKIKTLLATLIFKGTTLNEILEVLENLYPVCHFLQMIVLVSETHNCSVEYKDGKMTIVYTLIK